MRCNYLNNSGINLNFKEGFPHETHIHSGIPGHLSGTYGRLRCGGGTTNYYTTSTGSAAPTNESTLNVVLKDWISGLAITGGIVILDNKDQVTTGSDGKATFLTTAGAHGVVASSATHSEQTAIVNLSQTSTDLELRLLTKPQSGKAHLLVIVLDKQSRTRLVGAKIKPPGQDEKTSDANGEQIYLNLTPGTLENITTSLTGYHQNLCTVVVVTDKTTTLTVEMVKSP